MVNAVDSAQRMSESQEVEERVSISSSMCTAKTSVLSSTKAVTAAEGKKNLKRCLEITYLKCRYIHIKPEPLNKAVRSTTAFVSGCSVYLLNLELLKM